MDDDRNSVTSHRRLAGAREAWHNELAARISGTSSRQTEDTLPMIKVDVLREIARRPLGSIFIGA